jgi:hypothetical protein
MILVNEGICLLLTFFKLQIFAESLELIKKSLKIENKTNVNDKA